MAADPSAIVRTAMATYRGADGFLTEFPATADRDVGSMIAPAFMPELCECEAYPHGREYGDAPNYVDALSA
jgi:hypothetical protein